MDLDAFLESQKKERVQKYPLSMYYSEGTKYLNLCQYEKALRFLDKAVNTDPINVKSFLKRIKCLISLRKYKEAIQDANTVLRICPNCIPAIDLKGQAQYLMGDFEGGYLTYSEGRKVTPMNNNFRLGKQLCKQALDNSFHPSLGININKNDISSLENIEKNDEVFENQLKYRKSTRECFAKDRKFMEDLMADTNLTSVHGVCKKTVDYIKACERFWTMETPLHTRRNIPTIIKRDVKKPLAAEKQVLICKAAKRRAEYELKKRRIDDCLAEVGKMFAIIETLPKEREKDIVKLKCDAFHLKSIAYKKGQNHSLSMQYLMKELELANEFDLKIPQTRAYHLLGENYQTTGNISRLFLCFDKVVSAMDPEKINELEMEEASAEEVQQLGEANAWANSVVSKVMMSIRESIISPILDTIMEYSEELKHEDSNQESRETENVNNNNLEQTGEEIHHTDESNAPADPTVSNETRRDSVKDDQSRQHWNNHK